MACVASARLVSTALCALNCECCAADVRKASGGFHGTLLRSPRAHAMSQFSHCHAAHHGSWRRAAADVPLTLAEGILRATELACGDTCALGPADWQLALRERLAASAASDGASPPVRVISLENTQSHALTCSKSRGSVGHHFKVVDGADTLTPPLHAALESLRTFEWVGLTDLFEPSLCLLHYQANGTLPPRCNCRSPLRHEQRPLGEWVETRSKRRHAAALPPDMLAMLDAQTAVDAALFAAALRLLLGRLRRVEELTGASLLPCLDWDALHAATDYVPGLWTGSADALLA